MKKNIFKEYGFDTIEEYFNYIIESKINGQFAQVQNLIKQLSKKETGHFIKWCDLEKDAIPADQVKDYAHCKNAAIDILSEM